MESAMAGGIVLTAMLIGLAIGLIPLIFFCLTVQKALNRVSPENRAMQPGMVCDSVVQHRLAISGRDQSGEIAGRGVQEAQYRRGTRTGQGHRPDVLHPGVLRHHSVRRRDRLAGRVGLLDHLLGQDRGLLRQAGGACGLSC